MKLSLKRQGCRTIQITVMIALLFAGCVSKSQFVELQDRYDRLETQKAEGDKNCQEQIVGLTKENSVLFESNKELAGEKKGLEGAVATLQIEKSDLLRKKQQLEEQNQQLDAEKRAQLQQKQQMEQMVNRLRSEVDASKTKVRMMEDYLKIDIIDKLMFASGQAEVTRDGKKTLARIAPTLKEAGDKEILIVGHTDDLPPSVRLAEKYPSNWELSTARAAAIIHILQWGYGIAPERLVAQGVANYRPFDVESTDKKEIRQTNRVVEIILRPMPKK